jgi:alkylated DNA nucleotide flippase Atl1
MPGLNYASAQAFIASIPDGCWTSYKDVAIAAGNPDAAMSIGNWLRKSGGSIEKYWRGDEQPDAGDHGLSAYSRG